MPFLLSFLSGVSISLISHYLLYCSIVISLFSVAVLLRHKKFVLVFVVLVGIVYVQVRLPVTEKAQLPSNKKIEVTGRFVPKVSALPSTSELQDFVVERAADPDTGEQIRIDGEEKIRLQSDSEFDADETYELLIQTGKDRIRLNPGTGGRGPLYARLVGIKEHEKTASVFGDMFEKYRALLHAYIMERFGRDSGDFIAASTIGEVHFNEDLKNAFNITGLAHILSISGTHFGLLSVVIFAVIVYLVKALPYTVFQWLTIYFSPRQLGAIICIPILVFYLGISGGSVPAVRSFIMISLFLAGLLISRKGQWLNTVLLAASLLVLWSPEVLVTLTFQLSFIAVLFIGFSVERKEKDDAGTEDIRAENKIVEFVKSSLKLTMAAAIGTAPLVAYYFHYLSLVSPLANLVAAPLIGFIVVPLALISSFAYILTDSYLFAPLVGLATDLSLGIVKFMAKIPYADVRIPSFPPVLLFFFYGGFLLYIVKGRDKRWLSISFSPFLLYMAIGLFTRQDLSITFLDVGQGDSAVAELPDDRIVVIDSGRTGHETASFLKYSGRRTIDALVLTHTHPDHIGGAESLMRQFRVKELWYSSRTEYPEGFTATSVLRRLERGDMFEGKGYRISVLHPYTEFHTAEDDEFIEENNASLVLKVTGEKNSFLLLGDVEDEAEEDLLHLENWIKSDVIKVPHHGGRASAHSGLLHEVSSSIAVISVGKENSFGHPSEEMLEALSGSRIYRTDRDGAVRITETKKGLTVRTHKDFAMEKAGTFSAEFRNLKRLFAVW